MTHEAEPALDYKFTHSGGEIFMGAALILFALAGLACAFAAIDWFNVIAASGSVGVGTSAYHLVSFALAGVLAVLAIAAAVIAMARREHRLR